MFVEDIFQAFPKIYFKTITFTFFTKYKIVPLTLPEHKAALKLFFLIFFLFLLTLFIKA